MWVRPDASAIQERIRVIEYYNIGAIQVWKKQMERIQSERRDY
jgi:hypothetical protein